MVDQHETAEIQQEMDRLHALDIEETEEDPDEETEVEMDNDWGEAGIVEAQAQRDMEDTTLVQRMMRAADITTRGINWPTTRLEVEEPQIRENHTHTGTNEHLFTTNVAAHTHRTVRTNLVGVGADFDSESKVSQDELSRVLCKELKVPYSRDDLLNYAIADSRRLDFLEKYALMCLTKGSPANFDLANDTFNELMMYVDANNEE